VLPDWRACCGSTTRKPTRASRSSARSCGRSARSGPTGRCARSATRAPTMRCTASGTTSSSASPALTAPRRVSPTRSPCSPPSHLTCRSRCRRSCTLVSPTRRTRTSGPCCTGWRGAMPGRSATSSTETTSSWPTTWSRWCSPCGGRRRCRCHDAAPDSAAVPSTGCSTGPTRGSTGCTAHCRRGWTPTPCGRPSPRRERWQSRCRTTRRTSSPMVTSFPATSSCASGGWPPSSTGATSRWPTPRSTSSARGLCWGPRPPARAIVRERVGVDDATWERARVNAVEQALGGLVYYTPRRHPLAEVMGRTLRRVLDDHRR